MLKYVPYTPCVLDTRMSQPNPLKLNPDQLTVTLRELRDLQLAAHHLAELLESETLTAEHAKTVLYLSEHRIADVGKRLGVETQSQRDIEERHADLRAANMRVRALERQLGDAAGPEAARMALAALSERLTHWWRKAGLGHVSELRFTRYGHCEVKLSCMLFGDFRLTHSETPVSDKGRRKSWEDELREAGFVLVDTGDRDLAVKDCDSSREALWAMIQSALPSAELVDTHSHTTGHKVRVMALRDVTIFVRSLADLQALPDLPDEA